VGSGDGTEKRGEKIGEEKTANGGQELGRPETRKGKKFMRQKLQ